MSKVLENTVGNSEEEHLPEYGSGYIPDLKIKKDKTTWIKSVLPPKLMKDCPGKTRFLYMREKVLSNLSFYSSALDFGFEIAYCEYVCPELHPNFIPLYYLTGEAPETEDWVHKDVDLNKYYRSLGKCKDIGWDLAVSDYKAQNNLGQKEIGFILCMLNEIPKFNQQVA